MTKTALSGVSSMLVIRFECWEQALQETIPAGSWSDCREAIIQFFLWLLEAGETHCVDAFKMYLAKKKVCLPPERFGVCRQASDE